MRGGAILQKVHAKCDAHSILNPEKIAQAMAASLDAEAFSSL
jgi:hypothetical protein